MDVAGTKKCPLCAEDIEAGAPVCPHCDARFEVTRRGYCPSCHQVVIPVTPGVCPDCGGALIDETLESRFIGEGPRRAPSPTVANPLPPPPAVEPSAPSEVPAFSKLWEQKAGGQTEPLAPLSAIAAAPVPPWALSAEQRGLDSPPPAPPGGALPKRRRWLPWVIAAAIVAAAGAGVLAWWLLRGEGGGETVSTTSVPAEEINALSAYLAGVLEAEIPVGEASSAANAAATSGEAADTQRALAAAFGLYGRQVGQLDPPPSAREHQGLVLELAETANTLYLQSAEAVADNDTAALVALQGDLTDWMDLAVREATLRELLINTALSAHADLPLNRYLLDTGEVRSAIFADFQGFLGRVQTALTAGQWQASIGQIEEEIGIIDGFLDDWDQVVPPAEAAAYHTAQGDAVLALRGQLESLMSALESQSLSGVQGAISRLVQAAAQAQEALIARDELTSAALRGAAAEAFPLAGTWSGLANDRYSPSMLVTVRIDTYCEVGQVCGTFDIPALPCKGSYTYVGQSSAGAPYEFRAGDLEGACGQGRDFLKLLPDGTVQYSAVGDWGTTAGVLTRVNP
jgi:hypothetical protein